MRKLNQKWFKGPGPKTIWSHGSTELIPERFRRILTVVLPLVYFLLFLFGTVATFIPVPTFKLLIGNYYGSLWALLVAIMALLSFLGLVYRLRLEIYTNILLSILLGIYPFFVAGTVFFPEQAPSTFMTHGLFPVSMPESLTRLAVVFSVMIYPIFPVWRAFDIVLEIRKYRKRQLFAEAALGEA